MLPPNYIKLSHVLTTLCFLIYLFTDYYILMLIFYCLFLSAHFVLNRKHFIWWGTKIIPECEDPKQHGCVAWNRKRITFPSEWFSQKKKKKVIWWNLSILGQTHSLEPELSAECKNIFSLGCPTSLLLQGKAGSVPAFLQSPCLVWIIWLQKEALFPQKLYRAWYFSFPMYCPIAICMDFHSILERPPLIISAAVTHVSDWWGWPTDAEGSSQTMCNISVSLGHYSLLMSASTELLAQSEHTRELITNLSGD